MADQLATPEDLASALQLDYATLTPAQQASMVLLVECGTAVVQEAAGGQRIVQVVDDQLTIMGTSDSWLDLPQIPVTAVGAVTIDGSDVTDWKLIGNRLWRSCGWQTNLGQSWWPPSPDRGFVGYYNRAPEPSVVALTVTHGHADGVQELQLARSAVLSLASPVYSNPGGAVSESIDDYSVSFASAQSAMASAMDASPYLKAAIRRQYGRRGGLVRLG